MYSLSIDYLFNRVYDFLLWIKYTWLFGILEHKPEDYIQEHINISFDGLRDRGWFDTYLANNNLPVPVAEVHVSLWQKMLEKIGYKPKDSDGDGIPDISDSSPYDPNNVTKAQLKERYQEDYSFSDHIRSIFGIGPKDTDGDGIPDSYEIKHHTDPNNPDSDRDGLSDGEELLAGTDPLNNDTDKDRVLDGRDEFPLDGNMSAHNIDSDGDGVSDVIEQKLGTDIHKIDTDNDGIPDGMDTYPLDPQNISPVSFFDNDKVNALHFSIQNPVLSFLASGLSLFVIAFIIILMYAVIRWIFSMLDTFSHYEHHFYDEKKSPKPESHGHHVIKDSKPTVLASVKGLPVLEDIPVDIPLKEEVINENQKFTIIKGYITSSSEALWRIGIIEADNFLQEVLQEKGYQGHGVGEMLKGASFKTVQLAWDAHKIRNKIAHDGTAFQLTEHEAKKALNLYESVLRDLKAI